MLKTTEGPAVLNFIVTGQVRCGASVVQTSVSSHPDAYCHSDVLHADDDIRRLSHEDYFGTNDNSDLPDWCAKGTPFGNPEVYLKTCIFAQPQDGEQTLGVKLPYDQLVANDLWDFCREQCLLGDFTLIHVERNPLACFVSWKQAQKSGIWQQDINDRQVLAAPSPVHVDPEELTEFCRWHEAYARRVEQLCDDRLVLSYRELFLNYHEVMQTIFEFLELPAFPSVSPGVRRLKNRNIRDRVINFISARSAVPSDVRRHFDDPYLF